MDDFGILILSHGRADNVKTVKLLESRHCTIPWYIVIDDEDDQGEAYYDRYKDRVIVFDKEKYLNQSDTFCPSTDKPRGIVLPARNACFDIAYMNQWKYFIELDDDYTNLEYRWPEDGKAKTRKINDLNGLFRAMRDFVDHSGLDVLALAQGGDFIGGIHSTGMTNEFLRKMMNVYCFRTDSDIRFYGYINEDLTASILNGSRGKCILTYTKAEVKQGTTQQFSGGLTEEYKRHGTFAKSMTSVIACPSCVKVDRMGDGHYRDHHKVSWKNAVPKILRGEHGRKE